MPPRFPHCDCSEGLRAAAVRSRTGIAGSKEGSRSPKTRLLASRRASQDCEPECKHAIAHNRTRVCAFTTTGCPVARTDKASISSVAFPIVMCKGHQSQALEIEVVCLWLAGANRPTKESPHFDGRKIQSGDRFATHHKTSEVGTTPALSRRELVETSENKTHRGCHDMTSLPLTDQSTPGGTFPSRTIGAGLGP